MDDFGKRESLSPWQRRINEIMFGGETPAARWFDVLLIISIISSVLVVMLDSVENIRIQHGPLLYAMEWFFTIMFSIEYLLRMTCVSRPVKYATSFYGVVDLLAVVPTYLSVLLPGSQYLLVIRILRILRIFRVLKLVKYLREIRLLTQALRDSRRKITVFLFTVLTLVIILGSLMYLIEGPTNGFTSIPTSIYWTIVTLTTVGYGDISPNTPVGQFLAALIMIMGYAIIAVPTGIVTVAMGRIKSEETTRPRICASCRAEGHDPDARFCKHCGSAIDGDKPHRLP